MEEKDLKNTIDKHFDSKEVREFASEAVRIPHCNTEFWERCPQLHYYVQKFIQPLFEEVGLETNIDDAGHLTVRMGKGKTGKKALIMQHSMGWSGAKGEEADVRDIHETGEILPVEKLGIEGFNPKEHGVDGEVVWGRDAGECMGSLIAAVEAARIIARSGLEIPGEVIFAISAGGHQASSGNIFHLIHNDQIKADMAIHAGRHTHVGIGGLGRVDLKVSVYGTVTHSSFYKEELGLNAIDGAYKVLNRLQKIMPYPPGPKDPDIGVGPKLVPIAMESYPKPPTFEWGLGSAGHARQGLVRIALDRRIVPGEEVSDAVKQVKDTIGDLSPFKYKIETGAFHFPWKVPKDSPVIGILQKSIKAINGREADAKYGTSAWDMGALNKLGIPTVTYGAVGPFIMNPPIGPHAPNEFAVLNWIYEVSKVYAHFAVTSTATERAKS